MSKRMTLATCAALAMAWPVHSQTQAPAAPPAASAQPAPSAEALAISRRILVLSRTQEKIGRMIDELAPMAAGALVVELARLPAADNPFADQLSSEAGRNRFVQEFGTLFAARFNTRLAPLMEQVARTYAQRLSLEDLRAIEGFLASEIGGRWLAADRALEEEAGRLGGALGGEVGQEVIGEMLGRAAGKKKS